jgi:YD repeat-containing protein
LSGNRIYAKDYKQNATTTAYLAYGQPEFSKPLTISSPEGVVTSLDYNVFGNLTSVSQGGLTQYNVYDSYQQRCKEVRADIGNTAFHYNVTGEVEWFAHSTSVSGSTTACDHDVDAADKVAQDYDNFGAIKAVTYADSTPAKSYVYDKNGNLETLVFGGLTQSYSYDDRNNLTGEKHSSDGQLRNLTYKYNADSHLSEVVYPNAHSITFAPNALGQANYVYNSTTGYYYAKNLAYYPSGTIDSYTYGNNLVYKLTQNTELLPYSIALKNASNSTLSGFTYTYDNNSNIDRILDGQNSSFNVSMTYDGLDRLKTAVGNWGGGVFNYDLLGNITSYNLGGFGLTYTYDEVSKRLAGVTGSKVYSFSYDERSNVSKNTAAGVNMVYNTR